MIGIDYTFYYSLFDSLMQYKIDRLPGKRQNKITVFVQPIS